MAHQWSDGRAAERSCRLATLLQLQDNNESKANEKGVERWRTIGEPEAKGLALPELLKSTTLPRFAVFAGAGALLTGDGDRFVMRLTDL